MLVTTLDIYYLAFPNDRLGQKAVVAFTYTVELLQTVLSTRDAFRNFGTGWGNMNDLDAVGWLWFSVPVLGSISKSESSSLSYFRLGQSGSWTEQLAAQVSCSMLGVSISSANELGLQALFLWYVPRLPL